MSCLGRRLAVSAMALALVAACAGGDTAARKRADRARWSATLLSWAQGQDGTLNGTVRVAGPPRSDLTTLTVRMRIVGEDDATIESRWYTFDLSDVARGAPTDKRFTLVGYPHAVGGIGVDPVREPSPDELAMIPELN